MATSIGYPQQVTARFGNTSIPVSCGYMMGPEFVECESRKKAFEIPKGGISFKTAYKFPGGEALTGLYDVDASALFKVEWKQKIFGKKIKKHGKTTTSSKKNRKRKFLRWKDKKKECRVKPLSCTIQHGKSEFRFNVMEDL